jgi:DNA-binding transcriptional ArsR family regulator
MRYAWVPESIYRDRRIPGAALRVVICLLGHADKDGYCNPSVGELARELGRTRSTIRHHLKTLAELGHITREAMPRKDGSRGANRYCVLARREVVNQAPADRPAAAVAGGRQSMRRSEQQPTLLLPFNGRRRDAGRANDTTPPPPPARGRRAGLSLSVATALAEMKGWAK